MLKIPKGRNNPFRLIFKNYLRLTTSCKSDFCSPIQIDILIPAVEKDLLTLPFVIQSAKKNLKNPIGEIFIVGKKGLIENLCIDEGCTFLDENAILPIKKSDIIYQGHEWARSGWLFQQFIKLSADEIVKNENVLILDADTCLTSTQCFVTGDNKFIVNFSDEYHFPYGDYNKILPGTKRFFLSFICHHMIFNKAILKQIKSDIEKTAGKNWIEAVLTTIDFNESSCFSEYELYGNYVYQNFRNQLYLEYWANKSYPVHSLSNKTLELNSGKFKSISFHKHS